MAGSRRHMIGSIYSRLKGLLDQKVYPWSDRPLWFDVYTAFPPEVEPTLERKPPKIETVTQEVFSPGLRQYKIATFDVPRVKEIFYPEDILRAKYWKEAKSSDNYSDYVDMRGIAHASLLPSEQTVKEQVRRFRSAPDGESGASERTANSGSSADGDLQDGRRD